MGKKKAFTLLEIIVSVACMSMLVIVMYQIINSTVMYTVSGVSNVKAQDEIKQITEELRINIANATELYILNEPPTVKDDTYQYFYVSEGVIYYYNSEEIAIDVSDSVLNNIKFEAAEGSKILKYSVSAKQRSVDKTSNSSIYIAGLTDVINKPKNIMGSANTGSCIMFRVNSDKAEITSFVLGNTENTSLLVPIQGIMQNEVIDLYVPKSDIKKYKPTVTFVGDRVFISGEKISDLNRVLTIPENECAEELSAYELEKKEVDFSNPVYYYVIANENVREYKVRLMEKVEFEIYQHDSMIGDQEIIRFDKDFYVNPISAYGTLNWYTEGCTEPVQTVVIDETTTSPDIYKLTPKTLYDNNNGMLDAEKENYNYRKQSEYEDVMRYITVEFKPADGGDTVYAKPKLIYPVSENADQSIEKNFYLKTVTDIWVETKKYDAFADSWLNGKTGANAVTDFKNMYTAANGGDEYKVIAKLNTNTEGYDKAPDFVRAMYHVNTKNSLNYNNYVVEPRILAIGEHTIDNTITTDNNISKDVHTSYSRTVFSVDLEEYDNANQMLLDTTDRYELSATYSKSTFKNVTIPNSAEPVNIKNGDNISTSIGIFNKDTNNDGKIKGFRAVAGTENGKGYLKSVNYENVAIETTRTDTPNVMQEYRYPISNFNNLESVTVSLKAFRQSNVDKSILYYSNVDIDGNRVTNAQLEDNERYMKKGNPTLVGEGKDKDFENMLIGDNFYTTDKIDMMDNQNETPNTFVSTTKGDIVSFGMSSNSKVDASGKRYAQYITNISLESGNEYTLKLMGAKIVGHTVIDDMKDSDGKAKTATIVELLFDDDVRSGFNADSTDDANVDTTIFENIKNKRITKSILDAGSYTKISDGTYTQNLVADASKISFTGGGKTFTVLSEGDKEYAYKTANSDPNVANSYDTIIVLVEGELKELSNNEKYTINLETGSIRAVKGGDVDIIVDGKTFEGKDSSVAETTGEPEVPEVPEVPVVPESPYGEAVFNISDIFNDPNKNFDNMIAISHSGADYQTANGDLKINSSKNSIGLTYNSYYEPTMATTSFSPSVNAEKGFVIEAKTKRDQPFSDGAPRYESHAIIGSSSGVELGYVMHITDVFNWTEDYSNDSISDRISFSDAGLSSIYLLSTKNGQIIGTDKSIISGDYRSNRNHSVNGTAGRLYFKREAGKYYTFRATIKDDTVILQVFDENGIVPTYVRKVSGNNVKYVSNKTEQLSDGYTVKIPTNQLHKNVQYNKIGVRAGGGWSSLASDGLFYDEKNGLVIKPIK